MVSHPGDTATHLLGTRTATYGNSYISWGQVSVLSKLTRETEHDLVLSLAALGSPQQARDAVSVSQTCPAWTPLRCPLKPQPLRPPALPWRNVSARLGWGSRPPFNRGRRCISWSGKPGTWLPALLSTWAYAHTRTSSGHVYLPTGMSGISARAGMAL